MINAYRYNRFKGVTLLETMLVVALILLGVTLGIGQYQKVVFKRKAAQIQNSVILLGHALEQYYSVNCYYLLTQYASYSIDLYTNPTIVPAPSSGSALLTPTLATYITTPQLVGNAFGVKQNGPAAYTYTINVKGDVPVLSVSTQFSPTINKTTLSTLQGLLKPDAVTNKQFTWYTTSSRSLASQATELSTNRTYLEAMAPGQLFNVSSRQLAMQYYASGDQFTNVCSYWQQPQYRCTITGDKTRCDYQKKPA